jgi:hypothetical protein
MPELASSYLLPRILGFQRAKEIFFFGDIGKNKSKTMEVSYV